MFVYQKFDRPISVRLPECDSRNCSVETREKIVFIFDLLGEHEGKLIVETYDRATKRFEMIESSVELNLVRDGESPIDYYELAM